MKFLTKFTANVKVEKIENWNNQEMTKTNFLNLKRISKIVEKHFSLDDNSLELFNLLLFDNEKRLSYIDPMFYPYLNKDLRIIFNINDNKKSLLDEGWKLFKDYFHAFCENNIVTYENFLHNKITIDGNEYRLFKYLKRWYHNNKVYLDKIVDNYYNTFINDKKHKNEIHKNNNQKFNFCFLILTEKISASKLPDEKLKLIISFNFADWFLSSTGESWSSCLDLKTSSQNCYWAEIPGLIIDKNRALLYLTNNKVKKYNGIISKKMIFRTWLLLDKNNVLFPVRNYPSNMIDFKELKNLPFIIFDKPLKDNNYNYFSKYSYDLFLTNKNNGSLYIYQDGTKFIIKNNKVFIINGSSGYYIATLFKDDIPIIKEDTNYECNFSLDYLIKNKKEIIELSSNLNRKNTCYICGKQEEEYKTYYDDFYDFPYCYECYKKLFFACELCGNIKLKSNSYFYKKENDIFKIKIMQEEGYMQICSFCAMNFT